MSAKYINETLEAATDRASSCLKSLIPAIEKVALFGAGNMGKITLKKLRTVGIEPLLFIDDTPEKQGTQIDGVAVVSKDHAKQHISPDVTVIVTILNPSLEFTKAKAILEDRGYRVASLMTLGWLYPEQFSGLVNTSHPKTLVADQDQIKQVYDIWADQKSLEIFDKQVAWRGSLNFDYLDKPSLEDIYFPEDIDLNLDPNVSFVDAGAFNGDTLELFLTFSEGTYGSVVAIEPDPDNFKQLEAFVKERSIEDRAYLYNKGIGAETCQLRFNSTGDMSASLDSSGDTVIDLEPLSYYVREGEEAYIKFDIEGLEWETLQAAEDLISSKKPKLAISVYHDPSDLWRIPLFIRKVLPNANLYLRAHGVDGTDVVLYAL
jgi:FkbM family methyltransferase